jgi:hypothetical protein
LPVLRFTSLPISFFAASHATRTNRQSHSNPKKLYPNLVVLFASALY